MRLYVQGVRVGVGVPVAVVLTNAEVEEVCLARMRAGVQIPPFCVVQNPTHWPEDDCNEVAAKIDDREAGEFSGVVPTRLELAKAKFIDEAQEELPLENPDEQHGEVPGT